MAAPTVRMHDDQKLSIVEWRVSDLVGVYELTPHAENGPSAARFDKPRPKDGKYTADRSDSSWYAGDSQESIAAMMSEGWPEGAAKLAKLSQDAAPPVLKTRRRVGVWAREGSELSVERAMRGQWDTAWRTAKRQSTIGPQTIELYAMYGGSCGTSTEALFWQGAVCAVLSDILETAGYPVRITGCFMHGGADWQGWVNRSDVIVKEASEPMQLDSVAAVMCHAGLYRTFLFQSWLQIPKPLGAGLGPIPSAYRWNQGEIERMREAGELTPGGILVEPVRSQANAIAEIKRVLASLSVETA